MSEAPCPLWALYPAKGGTLGPELWGLEIPAKCSLGGSAIPGRAQPLSSPYPPTSFHLEAEKEEEKAAESEVSEGAAVGELKQRKVCRWGFTPD